MTWVPVVLPAGGPGDPFPQPGLVDSRMIYAISPVPDWTHGEEGASFPDRCDIWVTGIGQIHVATPYAEMVSLVCRISYPVPGLDPSDG